MQWCNQEIPLKVSNKGFLLSVKKKIKHYLEIMKLTLYWNTWADASILLVLDFQNAGVSCYDKKAHIFEIGHLKGIFV